MSQTDQIEKTENVRNDPAFEVVEVNTATGETIIAIQKGILGSMSKQLKNTSDSRKGASILRKMGHVLADCGNVQYGTKVDDTDLDPSLVTDGVEE